MRFSSINTGLTDEKIQSAISLVNQQGYAAIDLHSDVVNKLGKPLYQAIDAVTLHPQRDKYYNEIAFFGRRTGRALSKESDRFMSKSLLIRSIKLMPRKLF